MLDRLGRAICTAECLPRKELHEAWEMATRVRQCFTGGRVVDLCCGYGLLGQVMLLLDDSLTVAVAVDVKVPPNHGRIHQCRRQRRSESFLLSSVSGHPTRRGLFRRRSRFSGMPQGHR
jgi:hypothetical protein